MAAQVMDSFATLGTMTITLASLASSTAGVGRQSTMIDNTTVKAPAAQIATQITAGTSTGTNLISIYLIRGDNVNMKDDKAGASDAGWTQLNAPLLGNIVVGAGTNVQYQNVFDTTPLGHLGPTWGIGVVHNLGAVLNATSGSFLVTYTSITGTIV